MPSHDGRLSRSNVLQVKVGLLGVSKPPVWRRLLVPADIHLDQFHDVIQAAMGWENYHLHAFRVGGVGYAQPDPDDELGYRDERTFRLADLATTADRIEYEYDFGDSWEHELVVEARTVAADDSVYPACIAGRGACPPEDCGGSYRFAELKELLAGPPSAEREEMLEWAGGDYDPARFDLAAASKAVAVV